MRNLFIFLSIVFIGSPLFSQVDIYEFDQTRFKSFDSKLQQLPESIRERLQLLIPAEAVPSGLERFNRDEWNQIKFFTNMTIGESGSQETYIYYGWDISTQDWRINPYQQFIITYDSDGNWTENLEQEWDGTGWENRVRYLITFDSNGNQTQYLYQIWDGTNWLNKGRELYTYDTNGILIEYSGQTWDGTVWVNSFRNLITYDTNGFFSEILGQTWDETVWVNDRRFLYTHDSNGIRLGRVAQNWDGTGWVNDWRRLFTYDTDGNLTEYLEQRWDGTAWVNDWRKISTYDTDGNLTEYLEQMWDGTGWVNDWRLLYTYDTDGYWTELSWQNWGGTAWINDWQRLFTNDTDGKLIEDIHQTWDGVNWVNDYIIYVLYTDIVGVDESEVVPAEYSLDQNYPNPFNPTTTIKYTLLSPGEVSLIIYNLLGQEIARLVSGVQQAGNHKVIWDASKITSGIYFYRLQVGDFIQTRKMVLLK